MSSCTARSASREVRPVLGLVRTKWPESAAPGCQTPQNRRLRPGPHGRTAAPCWALHGSAAQRTAASCYFPTCWRTAELVEQVAVVDSHPPVTMCVRGCSPGEQERSSSEARFLRRAGGGRVRMAGEGLGVRRESGRAGAVGWAAPRDAAPAGFQPIGDFSRSNLRRQGA